MLYIILRRRIFFKNVNIFNVWKKWGNVGYYNEYCPPLHIPLISGYLQKV